MLRVCLYFQVHQPYRLNRDYRFFDIGSKTPYFDESLNRHLMERVSERCYIPTNKLLKELIEKASGQFKVAFSITGVCVEQMRAYAPQALDSFHELLATGEVELLNETYYHSLASVLSWDEFDRQILQHRQLMQREFGVTPIVFRNTELIADNELAFRLERQDFKGLLCEGAEQILGWRSPNHLYLAEGCNKLKLLLKNFRLSDDIAFRFSDSQWQEHPLTANKFAGWIYQLVGNADTVNLFMDYETFGEHQWRESGIFEFLQSLPAALLSNPEIRFATPSEVIEAVQPLAKLDIPFPISWADVERDLTAWIGNPLQNSAIEELYALEELIVANGDTELLEQWRRLQTSDHFYYMCTKWFSDGDVHKYFNPYESPHHAWLSFSHILSDLCRKVGH